MLETPILFAPYIRQEGDGARRYANDCGAAAIAMFLGYVGLPVPSVDSLAAETTLAQVDNGLTTLQLKTLAANHGLSLTLRNDLNMAAIIAALNRNSPALMLIKYGYIAGRQNQADLSGHFVLVVAVETDYVCLLDPDFWTPREDGGRMFVAPRAQFENSIKFALPPYQGLVL